MDQVIAAADRRSHADPEPRARHRAQRAAARRRPVDDLRLEPVVGLADQAGHQGDLSVARVRSSGRRRLRPRARPQHPRRRAAGLAEPEAAHQQGRQPQARASTSSRSATSRSASSAPRRRSASKAGGRRSTQPDMPRPKHELPQNVPDHMKLMLDLIVLAFQMDKTRIATLMLNNDLSQMNFKFLDGVQGALHLDLTHNGTRRRQGSDVPEDQSVPHRAVRLPHAADEGHLGGRDDAARQLDPDVRVEPVRRRRCTAPTSCRSC